MLKILSHFFKISFPGRQADFRFVLFVNAFGFFLFLLFLSDTLDLSVAEYSSLCLIIVCYAS